MKFDILISFNNFKSAIKDPYFWTWFLPLLTFFALGLLLLFSIFDFDQNYKITHTISSCRNLTDRETLAMLFILFLSIGGVLLTLGELFILIEHKQQKRKVSYLNLSVVSCTAIIATITALILSSMWCR